MFELIKTIIYFSIVLTVIVAVHEYGHYFVAKQCGVKVLTFSIGFGKKIFSFKNKVGEIWQVCCLPLGGYVKMFGDDNASGAVGYKKNPTKDDLAYSLIYKHPFKKILVAAAGPAMNYIFAILLFFFVFAVKGKPFVLPFVDGVQQESVAEKIGLKKGDKLIAINGVHISYFEDIRKGLDSQKDENVSVVVQRSGKIMTLTGERKQGDILGVMGGQPKYKNVSKSEALSMSFAETTNITTGTLKALWNIIYHHGSTKGIGGPIMIAKQSAKAGEGGFFTFLYFMACISVSLGLVNILPIPLLDGGHVVVNFIELVSRRRVSNKVYKAMVYVGVVIIALLMGLGFFNDIFVNR